MTSNSNCLSLSIGCFDLLANGTVQLGGGVGKSIQYDCDMVRMGNDQLRYVGPRLFKISCEVGCLSAGILRFRLLPQQR